MQQAAVLADRSVIALSGAGARGFLQGLVTNDVDQLEPGQAAYAALLTPQGKILYDFFVIGAAVDRFLIDCAAASAADLVKRLTLYRLRAKLEIAPRPDLAVVALWNGAPQLPPSSPDALAFADPRLPALGIRIVGPGNFLKTRFWVSDETYQLHRLSLGVPDSADMPPDTVFPLDAGLEELRGVNFKKGCYVGQEVTARVKHRSTARRRFLIAETVPPVPAFGTPITAGGREIGMLASGQGAIALALIRLDRLAEAEAAHVPIIAAGNTVTLRKPEWLAV